MYALEVSHAGLQGVLRVGFLSVEDVDVRCVLAYGHDGHEALALAVAVVVGTYQRVMLLDEGCRRPVLHGGGEVVELHPVESVLTEASVTEASSSDAQLIVLRDVPVVCFRRIVVVLLHLYEVTHAEGVVEASVGCLQPDTPRFGVVVVHLQHVGEIAVGVFSHQLTDDHLEDTERVADGDVVYLQVVLVLDDAGGVDHLLLLYGPSESSEEGADELRRGEVAVEGGVAPYLECRKHLACSVVVQGAVTDLRMLSYPQLLQLSHALLGDDTALKAFGIFSEDDGTKRDESLEEGGFVEDFVEGDLIEVALACHAQQV